ncbi:uncharacterized protein LOC112600311, partial [Melanaphis sacchari]|uniref:uncharacterized protein LOC112600311 n=1 Tax=Melanaphis sacchari TaxID=742174 RepID=UPI000DC13EFC
MSDFIIVAKHDAIMKNSISGLSSLKREVRFTVFEVISVNKTIATVQEATYKQFYDKQSIFVHVNIHESISQLEASFSVSKCKMHYIDCVNVVSYEIHDVCQKINYLFQFTNTKTSNTNLVKCPIVGEYDFKNITFDAEKFGSVFSFPTERWWEIYWKYKI